MSRFSGKCDFYDHIEIFGEEKVKNARIYIGNSQQPLNFNKMEDLIPYYPYIISIAAGDKNGEMIRLTSESYIDIMEKDSLQFYLKQILCIYNRCKRKKCEFNSEEVLKKLSFISDKDALKILIKRVKKDGKKAIIDGIHLNYCNFYRREMIEELKKHHMDTSKYQYEA